MASATRTCSRGMNTRPIFSVANHHADGCGTPPRIDGAAPTRYVGYFENRHGRAGDLRLRPRDQARNAPHGRRRVGACSRGGRRGGPGSDGGGGSSATSSSRPRSSPSSSAWACRHARHPSQPRGTPRGSTRRDLGPATGQGQGQGGGASAVRGPGCRGAGSAAKAEAARSGKAAAGRPTPRDRAWSAYPPNEVRVGGRHTLLSRRTSTYSDRGGQDAVRERLTTNSMRA